MNNTDRKMVLAVVEVLKKRFSNLSATELVTLAMDILDAAHNAIKEEDAKSK
jgi:hypothetical protein